MPARSSAAPEASRLEEVEPVGLHPLAGLLDGAGDAGRIALAGSGSNQVEPDDRILRLLLGDLDESLLSLFGLPHREEPAGPVAPMVGRSAGGPGRLTHQPDQHLAVDVVLGRRDRDLIDRLASDSRLLAAIDPVQRRIPCVERTG